MSLILHTQTSQTGELALLRPPSPPPQGPTPRALIILVIVRDLIGGEIDTEKSNATIRYAVDGRFKVA